MRLTGGQNIPSILHKQYTAVAGVERNIRGEWYISKRPKFQLPLQRGFKIRGLGFHDYESHCSKTQSVNRRLFAAAADCFKQQPMTGGVEWGEVGVINRQKWYIDAEPFGLWYYDWFMKRTMSEIVYTYAPMWWERYPNCTVNLYEDEPDMVGWNDYALKPKDSVLGNKIYSVLRKPANMNYLYICRHNYGYNDASAGLVKIKFSKIMTPVDDNDLTWTDNHLEIEDEDLEFEIWNYNAAGYPTSYGLEWFRMKIPQCNAVAIRVEGIHSPSNVAAFCNFEGAGYDCDVTLSPWWSITGSTAIGLLPKRLL